MSNPKARSKEPAAKNAQEAPALQADPASQQAAAANAAQERAAPAAVPAAGPNAAGTAREENDLRAENKQLFDQLLRLKAEFENYRKRVDREKPEWERMGRVQLLGKLLPLHDVLLSAHEQALRRAEILEKAGEGSKEVAELLRGLEMIFKEFTKFFEAEEVRAIEAVDKPYDFNFHDVIGQVETDARPEGVVVEEVARGYTMGGKVLRPARVRVAKKPASAAKEQGQA